MISRTKLKELSAYRQAKQCEESAVFVAEGTKMAAEAAASSARLLVGCATADWLQCNEAITARFDEFFEVSEADLQRLSHQKTPMGVWMLIGREAVREVPPSAPLVIALDGVQDPGNVGTILRVADWFGVRHVVCSEVTASNYNPKVVQASMGAVFRTNVVRVSSLAKWLSQSGREVCGADLGGEPLFGAPLAERTVLVIGNESQGLSAEVCRVLHRRLTIPNVGLTAESLNASVATGIVCAEYFRQHIS